MIEMAGSGELSWSLLEVSELPNQPELHGIMRFGLKKSHQKPSCNNTISKFSWGSMHLDPKGIGMLCTSSLVPNLARQIFFSPSYSSSYGAWVTGSRVI